MGRTNLSWKRGSRDQFAFKKRFCIGCDQGIGRGQGVERGQYKVLGVAIVRERGEVIKALGMAAIRKEGVDDQSLGHGHYKGGERVI